MIIKAIAQICKTRKTAVLYDTDEIQWITDGYATYPLYKMPRFNEETLPTLLDIPEKKVKSYILRTDEFPKSLSRLDYEEEEEAIEEFDINIEYQSDSLIPFNTSHGLVFMDSTYLKPLKDMSEIRFLKEKHRMVIYTLQSSQGSYWLH